MAIVESPPKSAATPRAIRPIAAAQPVPVRKRHYNFRAAVWRWHFYAGVLIAPLIVIISITGALLVFEAEFDDWYYANLHFIPPHTGPLAPIDDTMQSITHALTPLGNPALLGITVPAESHRSASSMALIDGPTGKYYVYAFANPYTAEYIGHYVFEQSPMRQIEQLHRRLLWPRDRKVGETKGEAGSMVVELGTSWAIVLLFTGLYLWWPRRLNQVWGVWLPRVRGKTYRVWRDWHTVPAVYLSIVSFLIAITGLVYSPWWGDAFLKVQQASADGNEPISLYRIPDTLEPNRPVLSFDEIGNLVRQHPLPPGTDLELQTMQPDSRYVIATAFNSATFNPASSAYFLVDRHTGEITKELRWAGYNTLTKARALSYSVHVGSIFGLPTKLLAVVAALGIAFAAFSGVVMWWKRRPRGTLGTPPCRTPARIPLWVIAVVLAIGAFFPAAGISFFAVLTLDYLWVSLRRLIRSTA